MNYNKIIDELLKSRTQLLARVLTCDSFTLISVYAQQIKDIDALIMKIISEYNENI